MEGGNEVDATGLLLWGIVAHLVADWLLQNDWMARNKSNIAHPAAWVHGGIHTLAMCLVFPWTVAVLIGLSHIFIDLRFPLAWWHRTFRQTTDGPYALHVAIWTDQVAHIVVLAIAARLVF